MLDWLTTLPYAPISPLLPYKEIVGYFFKLAQSVQIYSNIKGIKEQNFNFSLTLHLFFIVSTFMYIP